MVRSSDQQFDDPGLSSGRADTFYRYNGDPRCLQRYYKLARIFSLTTPLLTAVLPSTLVIGLQHNQIHVIATNLL